MQQILPPLRRPVITTVVSLVAALYSVAAQAQFQTQMGLSINATDPTPPGGFSVAKNPTLGSLTDPSLLSQPFSVRPTVVSPVDPNASASAILSSTTPASPARLIKILRSATSRYRRPPRILPAPPIPRSPIQHRSLVMPVSSRSEPGPFNHHLTEYLP
jgi:hypothetical protein